jgi:hypothetical protein
MITIVPHRGAGKIIFGMTRGQVEQAVGRPPRRRTKLSEFDLSEIDFFDEFAVLYDANDKCCAIEFSRGGAQVEYGGYELFAQPPDDVRAWARARDEDMEDKDGFVSMALGLSMYAPSIDEPDLDDEERTEPAQSFLAFRPGYWEEERERLKGVLGQK